MKLNNEEYEKQIEADNAAFALMTPEEKRVSLAEDVLKHLNTKKISATKGSYIDLRGHELSKTAKAGSKHSLKDIINNSNVTCSVCAKGALLISEVTKRNELDVRASVFNPRNVLTPDNEGIVDRLDGIFEVDQLDLIETAFEKRVEMEDNETLYDEYNNVTTDLAVKAIRFGKVFDSSDDRLEAIMLNIISNKGEFKPATPFVEIY